ncbi:MAG: potassium transporter Kup [Candidatus Rokubacteria bacterium]|nr:potassium transporter Kup [Candidatus Rokubacteria bacterium]
MSDGPDAAITAAPVEPAARPTRARPTRHEDPTGRRLATLSLLALGVVYGDIGTSPLYAFREAFGREYGLTPTPTAVYGVLSLIVWSLIIVVSVKYIALVMRADNRGEGGILALLALLPRDRSVFVMLGLFGAALLFGEGAITPGISVLGAAEGLEVVTPAFHPYVVPFTVVILIALFLIQKRGTAGIGKIFGPVMLVWFVTIAVLGAMEIARGPAILAAVNPLYAAHFCLSHGVAAFLVLGAVVLAVTGVEALYADMGHFGRRPIRLVWFVVVLPSLLLNYFGQGALIMRMPEAVQNPFYLLAPRWFLYPLLAIATTAAIVASQALISGAFSLAQQSIQLGYCPRLTIVHTSRSEFGQIYVPEINAFLAIGCLTLVLSFGSSSALAAAYGIAVTSTMAMTTMLFYVIARRRWHWSRAKAGSIAAAFLTIELCFLAANVPKVAHGGWVPLVLAAALFLVMTTWRRGTYMLTRVLSGRSMPIERFFAEVDGRHPARVPGTAVFLTAHTGGTPEVLVHHLRHNKVLHERIVFLSVVPQDIPEVREAERLDVEPLSHGFVRVIARYGFMETPDVAAAVRRCCRELNVDATDVSYYLGRPTLLPTGKSPMMKARKLLFTFLARNSRPATQFFNIPTSQVVELGMQIEF